ncbi:MAG: DNA primase [Bacillota bacterium]
MANITRDFIEEVKENIDIIEVVSEYVNLKRSGKNYKGLCPFHQESTPSFTINPDRQFYYCFGCGAGGDVLNFLMEIENITFNESLKQLADRAGLEMPNQSQYQRQRARKREQLFELNRLAAKFYNYLLLGEEIAEDARNYLDQRGFNGQDREEFFLGYAPDRWKSLYKFLRNRGYQHELLIESGLIKCKNNSYYDRFRGRIIFPIFNVRGEVLAFGARRMEGNEGPKYINSPETLIYDKGDNLYGINWARTELRRQGEAIIMEGYTDVLRAHKHGLSTAVASLGTSLTVNQARLLKRYVETVYIAYDADTAGNQATLRGLELLKNYELGVRIIKLPREQDPDQLIQKQGAEGFNSLREGAIGYIDLRIEQVIGGLDLQDPDNKITAARELVVVLAEIEDPIERDVYIQKITDTLGLKPGVIEKEVNRAVEKKNNKDKNRKDRYTKNNNKTKTVDSINKLERKIIKAYLDYPRFRGEIRRQIKPDFLESEYQQPAVYLWNYPEASLEYILEQIEDNEVKDRLMSLAVREKRQLNSEILAGWLNRLLEYHTLEEKVNILNKLENRKPGLKEINQLLLEFSRLNWNQEKGGYNDG